MHGPDFILESTDGVEQEAHHPWRIVRLRFLRNLQARHGIYLFVPISMALVGFSSAHQHFPTERISNEVKAPFAAQADRRRNPNAPHMNIWNICIAICKGIISIIGSWPIILQKGTSSISAGKISTGKHSLIQQSISTYIIGICIIIIIGMRFISLVISDCLPPPRPPPPPSS
eukprot:SAG31_NODE_11625_length_1012_cov_0.913472_1_plen_172_part_10